MGAACLRHLYPTLLALCIGGAAAAALLALLLDIRHHLLLSSFLRTPPAQLQPTDPHALSTGAARAALRLDASKRHALSAHLRALRAGTAAMSDDGAALAVELERALPGLADWCLEAPPIELRALQALLPRVDAAAARGPALHALRRPTRLALLRLLLAGGAASPLASPAGRSTLQRLLREVIA